MSSDEKSSTILATQARDGSLRRFGKALANLYRDNKIIKLDGEKEASSRREWVRSGKFRMPKFRRVTSFDSSDGSGVKLEFQTKSRQVPTAEAIKNMQEIDKSRRSQARIDSVELNKAMNSTLSIFERRSNKRDIISVEKLLKTTDLEKTRFVLSKKDSLGKDRDGKSTLSKRTSGAISYGAEQVNIKLATGGLGDIAATAAAISQAASKITWRDDVASKISKLDERSRQRGGRGL